MFYQCIAASTLFYTAHWQTYVSGSLQFGKFDVTEAQFTIMFIHIISATFGTHIWAYTISIGSFAIELKMLTVYFTFIGTSYSLYSNLCIIFTGGVGKNGATVADTSVLSPFIPIAVVVVPAFIIYQKSTTSLYEDNPCLYLMTFGLVIAKVTMKLVVAHMTKSEIEYLDSVLIGPTMLFLNQYFNTFITEYYVLWVALIWTIFDLLDYARKVCVEISSHLDINVFSIRPRTGSGSGPSSGNRADRNSRNQAMSAPSTNGRGQRHYNLRQARAH
jgi:hypothetical protein